MPQPSALQRATLIVAVEFRIPEDNLWWCCKLWKKGR